MPGDDKELFARLDGAVELAESGALAAMEPDDAYAVIATASPPEVPEFGAALSGMYVDGAFERWRAAALASAAESQAEWYADVAPALCRAAGLPVDAFGELASDPSLMADAYSAFLDRL